MYGSVYSRCSGLKYPVFVKGLGMAWLGLDLSFPLGVRRLRNIGSEGGWVWGWVEFVGGREVVGG